MAQQAGKDLVAPAVLDKYKPDPFKWGLPSYRPFNKLQWQLQFSSRGRFSKNIVYVRFIFQVDVPVSEQEDCGLQQQSRSWHVWHWYFILALYDLNSFSFAIWWTHHPVHTVCQDAIAIKERDLSRGKIVYYLMCEQKIKHDHNTVIKWFRNVFIYPQTN